MPRLTGKRVFDLLLVALVCLLVSAQRCQVCRVSYSWEKAAPITITQAARWFPTDPDRLSCMIPGQRMAFQVRATDEDLMKHRCHEECVNADGNHYHSVPDEVRIRWSVQNGGRLQQSEGEAVFYEIASGAGTATLTYRLDTPGDKATDDIEVTGSLAITTAVQPTTGCLAVTIVPAAPNRPQQLSELQNTDAPMCTHTGPAWEKGAALAATVAVSNPLCPRADVLLTAAVSDSDRFKIGCDSADCGDDELEADLSDVLEVTWDDGGAGGSFPLGNSGKQVVYSAPDDIGPIRFTATVDDSGSQFDDAELPRPKAERSTRLFDLTAVDNDHRDRKYRQNITVGASFGLVPKWAPAGSDVRRIEYKTDIGGPTGELDFKKCKASRMSDSEATLKFKSSPGDDILEVSWREHSHIHADALLDVRAWAMACGNACYCEDWAWEASNFATSSDFDEYNLYFDKKGDRDDGRVESLGSVRTHDEWGDTTDLGNGAVANWFLHWSAETYGASTFRHKRATTPHVRYRGGSTGWLGLFNRATRNIRLSDKAAGQSDRRRFSGARGAWWDTTNDQWYNARTTQQRAYDLVGRQLATKVYLHERAHYQAIHANWQAGGAWRTAYGPRSQTETANGSWTLPAANRISTTLAAVGNYNRRRRVGLDRRQKFNVTIEIRERPQQPNRVTNTFTINDAWFTRPAGLNRNSTAVPGGFELFTATERWLFRGVIVSRFTRANDPDDDYLPNQIEDQIGTYWNGVQPGTTPTYFGTHPGHERFTPPAGVAPADYRPDQEYWADHRVLGSGTPITGLTAAQWRTTIAPANTYRDKDWANPGAQSDPEDQ